MVVKYRLFEILCFANFVLDKNFGKKLVKCNTYY